MRTRNIRVAPGISLVALSLALAAAFQKPGHAAEAQDDSFYCLERKLGYYFYCELPKPPEKPEAPATEKDARAGSGLSATQEIAAIRSQLEELKAAAVLDPTEANVTAYIRFQRRQLDRASVFADVWQRALWHEPDLDYTLLRPVSHLAKKVWADERRIDEDDLLASLGERYGVFYIYSSACAACRVFSPLMRAFADRHGIAVKAVSIDGGSNDYFPDAVPDQGQVAAMGLAGRPVPAVILFDAAAGRAMPVGFGLLSEDELKSRIYLMIAKGPGDDF